MPKWANSQRSCLLYQQCLFGGFLVLGSCCSCGFTQAWKAVYIEEDSYVLWPFRTQLSLLSAVGQLLPRPSNGGNAWSQVQKQCSKRNFGTRAAGKTPCQPPECYFVNLPIDYYQEEEILTPEGRSCGLEPGCDLHPACKWTSPAALG